MTDSRSLETTRMCFWRHQWPKWTDRTDGKVTREGRVLGHTVIQERRCERCNALALRIVEARIREW